MPAACGNSHFDSRGPFSPAILPHLVLPPCYPPLQICLWTGAYLTSSAWGLQALLSSHQQWLFTGRKAIFRVEFWHTHPPFPRPGEFGILIWSKVCITNPFTRSMIPQLLTTHPMGSPYLLFRCFLHLCYRNIICKKGGEVSSGGDAAQAGQMRRNSMLVPLKDLLSHVILAWLTTKPALGGQK